MSTQTEKPPVEKLPYTQKQVEDFIMLCGQDNKPWFKLVMLDEDMANDPTALALMQSITDVIQAGIVSMDFEENMVAAKKQAQEVICGTH